MTILAGLVFKTDDELYQQEFRQKFAQKFASLEKTPELSGHRHIVLHADISAFDSQYFQGQRNSVYFAGAPYIGEDVCSDITSFSNLQSKNEIAALLAKARGVFVGTVVLDDGEMVLFSDKLGVRPFYLYEDEKLVVFSTQLSFINDLSFTNKEPCPVGMSEVLSFGYSLGSKTIYKHIKRLDAAQLVSIDASGVVSQDVYWDWANIPVKDDYSSEDVDEAYRLFSDAVSVRLNASSEQFAFLSGGLDSRAVTSVVQQQSGNLHTINFSVTKTQDGEYASRYARAANIDHMEINLKTLRFPNWSKLMAEHIGKIKVPDDAAQNRHFVWSGDGGSVTCGGVYVTEELDSLFTQGIGKGSVRKVLGDLKARLPSSFLLSDSTANQQDLEKGFLEAFESLGFNNRKRLYWFLMSNDQKRHLDLHFETIAEHKIELLLPFFDSDFVAKLASFPTSSIARHQFYMDWFERFPEWSRKTPWQTYPGHVECPIKEQSELGYQWDKKGKFEHGFKDVKLAFSASKKQVFRDNFNFSRTMLAIVLHSLGLKNYSFLLDKFKYFQTYNVK